MKAKVQRIVSISQKFDTSTKTRVWRLWPTWSIWSCPKSVRRKKKKKNESLLLSCNFWTVWRKNVIIASKWRQRYKELRRVLKAIQKHRHHDFGDFDQCTHYQVAQFGLSIRTFSIVTPMIGLTPCGPAFSSLNCFQGVWQFLHGQTGLFAILPAFPQLLCHFHELYGLAFLWIARKLQSQDGCLWLKRRKQVPIQNWCVVRDRWRAIFNVVSLSGGRYSAESLFFHRFSNSRTMVHTHCIHERDRTLRSSHEFAELGCDGTCNLSTVDNDVVNHELSLVCSTFKWPFFGMKKQFCAVCICSKHDMHLWIVDQIDHVGQRRQTRVLVDVSNFWLVDTILCTFAFILMQKSRFSVKWFKSYSLTKVIRFFCAVRILGMTKLTMSVKESV